ncbi:hypothetical protein E4T56_gene5338 [Termitomyces sp. T112]|nr:hypothetical protein E4T56_gene5338 [Termitomyces sp. T112]
MAQFSSAMKQVPISVDAVINMSRQLGISWNATNGIVIQNATHEEVAPIQEAVPALVQNVIIDVPDDDDDDDDNAALAAAADAVEVALASVHVDNSGKDAGQVPPSTPVLSILDAKNSGPCQCL